MALALPPSPARPGSGVARRILARCVAPALGLAVLLWAGYRMAIPPRGPVVEQAEMAQFPAGASELRALDADALTWQPLDDARLASWDGPYMLRYRFRFTANDTLAPQALSVSLRAAFMAYWDGVLIGANGVVGLAALDELPGDIDWISSIPRDRAGIGLHELRLLASSHHRMRRFRSADARVRVAPMLSLARLDVRAWLIPALALGALAASGLYVVLVIARTRTVREARDLMGLVAAGTGMALVEAWRPLVGYSYPWHATRLRLVLLFTAIAMVLLARYVARRTAMPQPQAPRLHRTLLLWPAFALLAMMAPTYDFAAWTMHATGAGLSLGLLLRAPQRHTDPFLDVMTALIVTALAAMFIAPASYLDGLHVVALATLMVVVLLTHAAHLRQRAERVAMLETGRVRLTTALLRRSIQPHWLMNTLTGLQELIERHPARASRLVELLADEFRLVTELSQRQFVPGEMELALCRTHLGIVSEALPRPRVLRVEGEPLLHEIALPPGILHALLENALTHAGAAPPRSDDDLVLTCAVTQDTLHVRLESPLGRGRPDGTPVRRGTGTQFVEASLEAAFPGAWHFSQGASDRRWHAELCAPHAAARAARDGHMERA